MTARRTLTFSILFVAASLGFATQTYAAWTEVQGKTTFRCEEILSEQCTYGPGGVLIGCKTVKKTKCVAVVGPGSGKPPASAGGDNPPPEGPRIVNFNKSVVGFATF